MEANTKYRMLNLFPERSIISTTIRDDGTHKWQTKQYDKGGHKISMTKHELDNMYDALELLRKTAGSLPDFQNADWKDVDDWIFSELQLTFDDIETIYEGRETLYYTGSAIKGFSPIAPTFEELWEIYVRSKAANAKFVCVEVDATIGKMVAVKAESPTTQLRDVYILTEADTPAIFDKVGANVSICLRDDTEINVFVETADGDELIYSVTEAQ